MSSSKTEGRLKIIIKSIGVSNENVTIERDLEAEENDAKYLRGNREPEFRNREPEFRRYCPYLHTINRQVLDFDFEKLCSVSPFKWHVYACLVCGEYYRGRGKDSGGYAHSLEAGHHVYINLWTHKVYCLPDGYQVLDSSLGDIRRKLDPWNRHSYR